MTAPRRTWDPGPAGLLRLLAVAATIATILAGLFIAFANLTGDSLTAWIATGLIAAGVALACLIIV
jgi:hypothetical protein